MAAKAKFTKERELKLKQQNKVELSKLPNTGKSK